MTFENAFWRRNRRKPMSFFSIADPVAADGMYVDVSATSGSGPGGSHISLPCVRVRQHEGRVGGRESRSRCRAGALRSPGDLPPTRSSLLLRQPRPGGVPARSPRVPTRTRASTQNLATSPSSESQHTMGWSSSPETLALRGPPWATWKAPSSPVSGPRRPVLAATGRNISRPVG